jgi:hypothetical protein
MLYIDMAAAVGGAFGISYHNDSIIIFVYLRSIELEEAEFGYDSTKELHNLGSTNGSYKLTLGGNKTKCGNPIGAISNINATKAKHMGSDQPTVCSWHGRLIGSHRGHQ